jgi:PiT family inorganic phosphate transporter
MQFLLFAAVVLVSYANGANDNFKGVATLWGANRTGYGRALAWATVFTFLGSLAVIWLGSGLAAKFSGSNLLAREIYTQLPFLTAVAGGAGATVLLAARLGLPISTTHALTGSLVGAGVLAGGFAKVKFAALSGSVAAPLLFSPLISLALTLVLYPVVVRVTELAGKKDCVCVDEPAVIVTAPASGAAAADVAAPAVRWARGEECQTGSEVIRFTLSDALHWFSAAAISFARGLNDTPKIATLLVAAAGAVKLNYGVVASAMAVGGALGAARVAQTMSKQVTPMANREAVTANLVAGSLILLASGVALPVSTTHVTSGSIFGIGLLRRREADWGRVRDIVLSWAATLPLGAALAGAFYWVLGS